MSALMIIGGIIAAFFALLALLVVIACIREIFATLLGLFILLLPVALVIKAIQFLLF